MPTTDGHLVVESDLARLEADLEQFLSGQAARWDEGDAADRFVVLIEYLFPLGLFWAAAVLYGPATVGANFVAALSALAGLGLVARKARLGDVEIDHDAVEAVHLDIGDRTLDLEYDDYRPGRWATPDQSGYGTTLQFPSDEATDRARTALTESPLADRLEVTEADDDDVETDHRVDVEDGVLFCESCGTQVSPTDTRCPTCDYRIRAGKESPDAADFTVDDPERETETVYRVETEKGVPFCENCGATVSPTDDACRSCDCALRVARGVAAEVEE